MLIPKLFADAECRNFGKKKKILCEGGNKLLFALFESLHLES